MLLSHNSGESYNYVLNSKFNYKPSIWKFISIIKKEEYNLNLELDNIKKGEIKKKKLELYLLKILLKNIIILKI